MLYQNCVWFEDQTIFGLRVLGSNFSIIIIIVLSAQIPLKDYYIFHPIWIKPGMYRHWANVLLNCVQIRNLTSGGGIRPLGPMEEYSLKSQKKKKKFS